jgi:hypothetical protein
LEFARNVYQLEQSVRQLVEDNKELRVPLLRLQEQLSEHNGQLQTLTSFVQSAIGEAVERRAEEAARRLLARRAKDDDD